MIQRLFALVVALSIVSAPVALEICQITCESKATPQSMSHSSEGHAAHHHMPAHHAACAENRGALQQLSPVNGLCDHDSASIPSLVVGRNSDSAVTLLATVPSIHALGLVRTRAGVSAHEVAWSNRLGTPLAIPLRV